MKSRRFANINNVTLMDSRESGRHVTGPAAAFMAFVLAFMMSGCKVKPEPIQVGVDSCETCRMRITDARFGGEVITKKGRVYKFDSLPCLVRFVTSNKDVVETILASDFLEPGKLIDVHRAVFLSAEKIKGPMGSGLIATENAAGAKDLQTKNGGGLLTWEAVMTSVH